MKILITGICGFVGSTLARGLREHRPDWEVVGLDNLIRAGSEINRAPLRQLGVRLVHADLRVRSDLEGLPPCDWILDAAANPSVLAGVDGRTSSRQLVEHNLVGTIQLLELARAWSAGVIILSTSRVYSIPELAGLPVLSVKDRFELDPGAALPRGCSGAGVAEEFSTEPPLSLYGTTKRASELLALEYAHAYGLPVFLNRCGVLAGAGQFGRMDQGIFSFWIHSWCRRRPLRYIGFDGAGHQVRDCLHANDLLPLVLRQLEASSAPGLRTFNVSGGLSNSASLRELSAWCEHRFGSHGVTSDRTPRPFDVPWLVLNSGRAAAAWNWSVQTPKERIWEEIAAHAERHPHWLDTTSEA